MQNRAISEIKKDANQTSPLIVKAEELIGDISQLTRLIERRAYELFDGRGRQDGYDLADWLRAEAELLHPVPIEITESGDHLTVRAEVPGFTAKEIELGVDPRHLFIRGRAEQASEQKTENTLYSERLSNEIFRVLDLPVEIDAERVMTKLRDGVLQINLPKRATSAHAQVKANAA